ncbi:MAG: KH domain-containing protein [Bacilli bacterium]|nr:KH domain-containing protein [Bacilli bacterium]
MEVVRNEAKSKEEALEKSLEELNVRADETFYYFDETEGGLFKSKKYVCVLTTKYSVKEYIKQFLNELARKMNTKFNIEVMETEVGFSVIVIGDNSGALIGKDGRTLNSIQTVLRQSIKKYGDFDFRVNIDISNYKAKKERNFSYEIKKICRDVLKSKVDVKLDPMNSYERRIVHNVVSGFKNLSSESVGVNPNRYTVIKYIEIEED